ncbi:MAG TPA: hypothetical protein VM597_12565 [Gemmataceae bacterium]|nr:hypothetical protein [Gemmataceae bacterium]
MHILSPQPRIAELSMFFNVDTSVGEGGSNASPEDILLVQFLVRKVGETVPPGAGVTLDRKARMMRVPQTGVKDPLTADGIRAVQESMRDKVPSTKVDGRVSVARGYKYGGGAFTIVSLNATVRAHFPRVWPRLQDFPDCPGLLRMRVQDVL